MPARTPATVRALPERWSPDAIVRGLHDGRVDAVAALFDRMAPLVNRLVGRLLGPDAEHDDVVQQVFVSALASARSVKDPERLESWMVGVTMNTLRRELRTRTTWRRFFSRVPPPVEPSDEASSPHEVLVHRRFLSLIARLPIEERLAFSLRHLEDLTLPAVAEGCGCSLATAKRRIASARDRLVGWMTEEPLLAGYVVEEGDDG